MQVTFEGKAINGNTRMFAEDGLAKLLYMAAVNGIEKKETIFRILEITPNGAIHDTSKTLGFWMQTWDGRHAGMILKSDPNGLHMWVTEKELFGAVG